MHSHFYRLYSLDITQEQQLVLTNTVTNSILPSKDCIEGRVDLKIERFPDCELIGEPIYTPQYPYYQPA